MEMKQLGRAVLSSDRVIYDGTEYIVHGVIYRKGKNGGLLVQVELLDKNKNSLLIANPKMVNPGDKKTMYLIPPVECSEAGCIKQDDEKCSNCKYQNIPWFAMDESNEKNKKRSDLEKTKPPDVV